MIKKYLCVMTGYDDTTEKYFKEIQGKLYDAGFSGTQTKDLPMHITLGVFSPDKENELIDKLTSVVNTTEAFDISFNHIGIFQGSRVLFIAPDTNKSLLDLKEAFGDSFGWTAHTTMLIDEPNNIYKAAPIVLDNFSSYIGKVTTLHLFEFFPKRRILTVHLKNKTDENKTI